MADEKAVPATHHTYVGTVPATLGSVIGDYDVEGPVDVNVLTDGTVELSFGASWATLTETSALFLADALLRATVAGRAALARHQLQQAEATHAKAAFAHLGLEWM